MNLAYHKSASQPSTYSNAVAARAVDGSDGTVSCTLGLMHPWWSVDLGASYDVSYVTVTNDRNAPAGNYPLNYYILGYHSLLRRPLNYIPCILFMFHFIFFLTLQVLFPCVIMID